MFVNYFITIYLHNYIISILFAYYYIARIIIIIILFRDTQSCAARSYLVRNFSGSEEASASYVSASRIRPGYNQSLFYRVTHLIADALRHHDSKMDSGCLHPHRLPSLYRGDASPRFRIVKSLERQPSYRLTRLYLIRSE